MPLNNVSVLLVDDERTTVDLLSTFLSGNGFVVTGVSDPKEALKQIKDNIYDIILTDLKMPEVSGMDIVKAVKQTGCDTQVIIFTAYASIDSAIDAIKHGVYEYIRKPFRLQEIQIILNRAAEKLYLRRDNIALHKRIEMMLSEITMLYEISTILYQVPEYESAIEMVLDTLTEGMQTNNAGILLLDESFEKYYLAHYRGLPKHFVSRFRFRIGDSINTTRVSLSEPTIITNLEHNLTINGKNIPISKNIEQCILLPIQFLNKSLGFLGIFQIDEEVLPLQDKIKLLKTLTTQIAPIFQIVRSDNHPITLSGRQPYESFYGIIEEGITSAQKMNSSMSFALLRMIPRKEFSLHYSYRDLRSVLSDIIDNEVHMKAKIMSQNFDSIFIVFQGINPVDIELSCAVIRRKIEELYSAKDGTPLCSMKYALTTYPIDGQSVEDITNRLGARLINELSVFAYS